jgi:2-oxo-4-hydroxy-4-carboxy-5-ureidoimidazoline decarboxylase
VATTLEHLNTCPAREFIALAGPVFEHSPWIAEAAEKLRPFRSRESLHALMCHVVRTASRPQQLALIRAHPDLVSRAVLTPESTREQAAAGLMQLSAEEMAEFDRCNREYREKFGFPFVICARRNDKQKILSAFSIRLLHTMEEEISTALHEIYQIANLRILDLVAEPL